MKFYETHFDEYLNSFNNYNIHPEVSNTINNITKDFNKLVNIILYGPSGIGKYTQALNIIKKFSPSGLKYEKHVKLENDKQNYCYKISDIHYEIDMSLLGVNSKLLWHDIFMQIIDIIQVKPEKKGIIMCKNFHTIHTELLEIFYSYIQHYNNHCSTLQIKFIIITEHISFIPNNILNTCAILHIKRPKKEYYIKLSEQNQSNMIINTDDNEKHTTFIQRVSQIKKNSLDKDVLNKIMENIEPMYILNCKEMKSFSLLSNKDDIPVDIFNTICNSIIHEIENPDKIIFTQFRDIIYDILIYNLDTTECLWYILTYFIKNNKISKKNIQNILKKTYIFLKQYNNNYRPIYHLESIFFYIINKIYSY